jgi:hypothetical protein
MDGRPSDAGVGAGKSPVGICLNGVRFTKARSLLIRPSLS